MNANTPTPVRVKKAPPKAGRKRRGKREPLQVTPELLRGISFFADLTASTLAELTQRCQHVEIERAEHLYDGPPQGGDDAPVFFILFGDVSVHQTRHSGVEETVNYLSVGEVYVERLVAYEDTNRVRLTAMCPVKALRISYRDVNTLLQQPGSFQASFSDAIRQIVQRQKSRFDNEFQQDIARFLVKERLTFAGRIKLKRMDMCIECDGCYQACETRHGTDRLGPSEVKYGLTEIPQNCHNCVVPECMDKCKFGHIGRDPETLEIVIDDNCIGCTLCAKGCSFGSIRMHPLSELDVDKYFPDRAADAKGKSIAQKCDNCTGYEDQACVSACPTGALFQIDGVDVFSHWEQFTVHDRPGFEAVSAPEQTHPTFRNLWMGLTLINTILLAWECFGRHFWTHLTFGQLFFNLGWTDTPIDAEMPFRPGDFFGHSMGYVAGALVICSQVYRLRHWIGRTQQLMEAHIWLGVLGTVYAFFHTAFYFSDPIAVTTLVTLLLALVTGVFGRFFLYLVPRNQAGAQMELAQINERMQTLNQEIEQRFEDTRSGYTMVMRLADLVERESPTADADSQDTGGFLSQLVQLIRRDRNARQEIQSLTDEMAPEVKADARGEMVDLLNEKARLERSVRQHDFFGRVLKTYRVVHVTSSNIMFGALFLHVLNALMYQV